MILLKIQKNYTKENIKLKGALIDYRGENDVNILKTEVPDITWKY